MRYHGIADPIKIIVTSMSGQEHILFTERAGETVLDVKNALRPHIPGINPYFEMVLRNELSRLDDLDDNALVSSLANNNIVNLDLLFNTRTRIDIYMPFNGHPHTVVIDNNKTILDVKRALLPLLDPRPLVQQVILTATGDHLADYVQVSDLALEEDGILDLHAFIQV